jgi:predicted negative regulator of RcsB-dependent stress response
MAIDELLDEHEQSERVREWLRRNGSALILGISLGLAAIGGWQWWQRHQANQQSKAAGDYQATVDAIRANDQSAAGKDPGAPEGILRTLAQLELAKSQVKANQNEAAIGTLRAVRTSDPALAASSTSAWRAC